MKLFLEKIGMDYKTFVNSKRSNPKRPDAGVLRIPSN